MSDGKKKREIEQKWVDQVTPEIVEAVKAKAVEGKITCPKARKLADDLGVANLVVGAAADQAGLRVENCDLGCF